MFDLIAERRLNKTIPKLHGGFSERSLKPPVNADVCVLLLSSLFLYNVLSESVWLT